MVKFTETHVGHDELRSKRLSKDEQKLIHGQLTAGVTNNMILQDEIKIEASSEEESEDLCVNEPSTSQLYHQNNVTELIQENSRTQDRETSPSFNEMREIGIAEMSNFSRTLDSQEFDKLMSVYSKFKNDIMEKREQDKISKKRKIGTQTYCSNKK